MGFARSVFEASGCGCVTTARPGLATCASITATLSRTSPAEATADCGSGTGGAFALWGLLAGLGLFVLLEAGLLGG